MSADERKSMLQKKATCRCGHPDCPHPAPEVAQPCGHPVSAVVSSDEGTAYCAMCEREPTCGIAGCVGKHHPQDHNDIIDASTDDQSRSLFHSLQDVILDALRAELERVKAERNTIHDWYVDAKTENVALRAEVERMRPIVEAAIAVIETDKRLYHGAAEHAEAEAEAAFSALDEAVEAYRKDTNDE